MRGRCWLRVILLPALLLLVLLWWVLTLTATPFVAAPLASLPTLQRSLGPIRLVIRLTATSAPLSA